MRQETVSDRFVVLTRAVTRDIHRVDDTAVFIPNAVVNDGRIEAAAHILRKRLAFVIGETYALVDIPAVKK